MQVNHVQQTYNIYITEVSCRTTKYTIVELNYTKVRHGKYTLWGSVIALQNVRKKRGFRMFQYMEDTCRCKILLILNRGH